MIDEPIENLRVSSRLVAFGEEMDELIPFLAGMHLLFDEANMQGIRDELNMMLMLTQIRQDPTYVALLEVTLEMANKVEPLMRYIAEAVEQIPPE